MGISDDLDAVTRSGVYRRREPGDTEARDGDLDALMAHLDATTSDVYVHVSRAAAITTTADLGRGVRVDLDEDGDVVGIEILDCEGVTVDGRAVPVGRTP